MSSRPGGDALHDEPVQQRHQHPGAVVGVEVAANHATLDALLRRFAEQGLSPRRRSVEELFVPELLAT